MDASDKIGIIKDGPSDRVYALVLLYVLLSIPVSMPIIGLIWGWRLLPLAFFVGLVPVMVGLFVYLIWTLIEIVRHGS